MQLRRIAGIVIVSLAVAAAHAAPPIELEVATERGLQITAPQQWMQLLAELGPTSVRIRGAQSGDKPHLTNYGTADRPAYRVLGVLTTREVLMLPGGTFHRSDREKIRDYFQRLAADGPEGVTAPRGRFGLTDRQFRAVHEDLSRPIPFSTKAKTLPVILQSFDEMLAHDLAPLAADKSHAEPFADEVQDLTAGTGLALVLRRYRLMLVPTKPRGRSFVYQAMPLDAEREAWPVGWDSDTGPRQLAPALFELVNVQVANHSLRETLEAIQPRIEIPFYLDHTALVDAGIDPDAVVIQLPRTRTYYKRALDRILFGARLHGDLRVDEAGTVFYWITR